MADIQQYNRISTEQRENCWRTKCLDGNTAPLAYQYHLAQSYSLHAHRYEFSHDRTASKV